MLNVKYSDRRFRYSLLILLFILLPWAFNQSERDHSFTISNPKGNLTNDLDFVELNYELNYRYVTQTETFEEIILLKMEIQGTQLMYENGTISYYLPENNITDTTLLDQLSLFFDEGHINYFSSHNSSEAYISYFRQRNETDLTPTHDNFNYEARYTAFWIKSIETTPNDLQPSRTIIFSDVTNPFRLVISDKNPSVAESSWSDAQHDLARPVRIISTHLLSLKLNDVDLKLYYDKTFGILLRASVIAQDGDSEQLDLDFRLISTNLELVFQEDNPYWNTLLRNLIIGVVSSIGGVAIIITGIKYFTKQGKGKKQQMLDQI